MATYYMFKYKGRTQPLKWDLPKVLKHILEYVKKGACLEDYEIIKIEETNLGHPYLSITVNESKELA